MSKKNSKKGVDSNMSITRFLTTVKTPSFGNRKEFVRKKLAEGLEKVGSDAILVEKESNVSEDPEKTQCGDSKGLHKVSGEAILVEKEPNVSENPEKMQCGNSLAAELKKTKVLLKKASEIILEKELRIKFVQNIPEKMETEKTDKVSLFSEYSYLFRSNDFKAICSVQPGKNHDSNFVLKLMKGFYRGTERVLSNRSAVGRKHNGTRKDAITPEKKKIITEIFNTRIISEMKKFDDDAFESKVDKRTRPLNRFIRSAIGNILASLSKPKRSLDKQKPENGTKQQPEQLERQQVR